MAITPAARTLGAGEGGDITFAIDERAEAFMERFLAERAPDVAFYSEDRGLVSPGGTPSGSWSSTRSTARDRRWPGFEAACVRWPPRAWTPTARPTMGDVETGCVVEIKSGRAFVAERGGGLEPAPSLSANRGPLAHVLGLRAAGTPGAGHRRGARRPDRRVLGRWGTFDLGSATYDMTRIVTGQLDAYVEPGPRIVAEVPGMRGEFERVGGGVVLNNSPYDLAAAALILEEAGAVVTDA